MLFRSEALDPLEALKLLEGQLSPPPKAPEAVQPPAAAAGAKTDDNVEYGLMISGLGFGGKKQKAIVIIMDLLKTGEDEARDMVRSPENGSGAGRGRVSGATATSRT